MFCTNVQAHFTKFGDISLIIVIFIHLLAVFKNCSKQPFLGGLIMRKLLGHSHFLFEMALKNKRPKMTF